MLSRRRHLLWAACLALSPSLALANEGGGSLPQFDPHWFSSQIFWLVVHFAAFYVISAKLILPRMKALLARREARLKAELESAQKLSNEAHNALGTNDHVLADARTQAAHTRTEAMQNAEASQKEAEKKVAADLAARADAALSKIEQSRAEMNQKMRVVAAEATTEIVARLAGLSVDQASVDTVLGQVLSAPLKEVA